MSDPAVKIGCFRYDTTRALFDGSVTVAGAAPTIETAATLPEIFERMVRGREFDVAELGLTFYLRSLDHDAPFIAIPVFPNRVFRHSCMFVNTSSGIDEPKTSPARRSASSAPTARTRGCGPKAS